MRHFFSAFAVLFLCLAAMPVLAKDVVQTGAMKKEGFGDVAEVYNKMDAGQKKDVSRQAKAVEQKLNKMSNAERVKLQKQLKSMAKSLGVKNFDVSSINTKKKVTLKSTKKDFTKYKKMLNKNDGIKPFSSK